MDLVTKLDLIKEVGEEIITEEDLKHLLETKDHPIAYDGFEPSGTIHIAQGLLRAINIDKMLRAGCKFKILVADWHAWANNKMGGDLERIQTVGNYFIEVWKAAGLDVKKVEFVWAKDLVSDSEYWKKVMQIARNSTVSRIKRCGQIMGREESDSLQASQIFYPCMQCADIFHLKVDIPQLGVDQRKVNVLARELGPKLGWYKPIAVHHHMLMGLGTPPKTDATAIERTIDLKMSKSKPETAIFMNDTQEQIKEKISKAYCTEKVINENPIIDYSKYLVFEMFDAIKVERPKKFGGDIQIGSYDELVKIYAKGDLHPMDLKQSVAVYINMMLEPVRKYFEQNKKANELMKKVKSFEVTR